jgi:HAD superfamily hydrolase (TIGR01549 family)
VEATRVLAARFKLVGISNGRREVQEERLRRVGLGGAFAFVLGPEDCGFAKPHPGLFRLALERAGNVDPARVMVVGDGLETDIQGAADYGLASCWLNPEGLKRAPQDPVPTLEVKDLPELCRHLL